MELEQARIVVCRSSGKYHITGMTPRDGVRRMQKNKVALYGELTQIKGSFFLAHGVGEGPPPLSGCVVRQILTSPSDSVLYLMGIQRELTN